MEGDRNNPKQENISKDKIIIDGSSNAKSKLKGLFDEIDKSKSKKGNKMNNVGKEINQINKNNKNNKNNEIYHYQEDKDKFKTKPTKPDFSTQSIENAVIGMNINKSAPLSQYKGLTNVGNICYSNVVMQCLIALKEFVTMLNIIFKQIEEDDNIEYDYPVFFNLVKIMTYYQSKNTTLASNHIKVIVNLFDSSGEQNDAHEFLVFIFDRLNDEILTLSKKMKITVNINTEKSKSTTTTNAQDETEWEEVKKGGKRMKQVNTLDSFQTSIIGRIFQGILKHEIELKGKSLSKCNIEPFFVLSLDFGENSIDSCFKKYFSKRKIEGETQNTGTIYQKTYIEKLPSIFIVHLKSFYYDKNLQKIVKINKEIEYGNVLKLSSEFFSPSVQIIYKGNEYELISVIIHKGTKASEGHYVCISKDEKGNWWSLDDKKVFKVDESVFERLRPYILFYRKL